LKDGRLDISKSLRTQTRSTTLSFAPCALCYPIAVLGLPPSWYKKEAYRSRTVREPRTVLAEFGVDLPDEVVVNVWDSTAELRYLVLPQRPEGTDGWVDDDLAALVTRNSMIGTERALPIPATRA
jgi:nitrile hydratase subunit alpha